MFIWVVLQTYSVEWVSVSKPWTGTAGRMDGGGQSPDSVRSQYMIPVYVYTHYSFSHVFFINPVYAQLSNPTPDNSLGGIHNHINRLFQLFLMTHTWTKDINYWNKVPYRIVVHLLIKKKSLLNYTKGTREQTEPRTDMNLTERSVTWAERSPEKLLSELLCLCWKDGESHRAVTLIIRISEWVSVRCL